MNSTPVFSRSRLPMYAQLAALLRRRIETGEWLVGQQLPTLEGLEAEYRVARVTVRQAIGLLEEEGMIWRKQGKGTFVARGVDDQRWLPLATQWQSLMQVIDGTSMRVVSTELVTRPQRLLDNDGRCAADYQRIQRVHSKTDTPYCVIDLYIASQINARAGSRFQTELALKVISSLPEVKIGSAHQTLTIGCADIRIAELLLVELHAPVAEVRRVITDGDGMVIYYAEITYRGDFVKLEIDLLGNYNDK